MSKIRFGIIGAGMIGDTHIENIQKDSRSEIVSIATRTEKTLEKKKKKFPGITGSTDYNDILNDQSINAVIIATPPNLHLKILKEALEAGKNIIIEKPMTINPDELDKLVSTVKGYPNQLVLECSCRHARLQPKFIKIKQMIQAGELGEIYHIHHNQLTRGTFIEYNPAGAWAHSKELAGGGPILDWGVYDLSFHLGLLNDKPQLQSLNSFTKNGLKKFPDPDFKSDIEEHGVAFMEFDNGLKYYYERGSGVHAEVPNETRIYGTKGSLRFAYCSWDDPEVEFFTYDEQGKETTQKIQIDGSQNDDGYELIKHFLDCLIDGAQPQMTVELAAKHLKILYKIINS